MIVYKISYYNAVFGTKNTVIILKAFILKINKVKNKDKVLFFRGLL